MHYIGILVAALLAPLSTASHANVIYEFSAVSSFGVGDVQVESGAFTIESSDFITSDTYFGASDWLSCSVVLVVGSATCAEQGFLVDFIPGYDIIGFGFSPDPPELGQHEFYYYFSQGAFQAVGSYDTQIFDNFQAGRLSVSNISEPASLHLLIAALLTFGVRRGVVKKFRSAIAIKL